VIAVSASLVALAAVLLAAGLVGGSGQRLFESIAVSAIAALALLAGVRRRSAALDDDLDV
jgi:hypothetical protein